jgi:hypothetical protein
MTAHPSTPPPRTPPTHWPPPQRPQVGKSDGALIAWTVLYVGFSMLVGVTTDATVAGILLVLFVPWAFVAFWLTIIYLIARAGRRRCPVCGATLRTGDTGCGRCGHDFAQAAQLAR